MKAYIEERAVTLANYIVEHDATVREAAKVFGISKSSVHKDVAERLWEINQSLAKSVQRILSKNKADRHIRGGQATKHKYEMMKSHLPHSLDSTEK